MFLPCRPPYDWDALSRFLGARAAAGVELVTRDSYARTFEVDGVAGHVEIRPDLDHDRFKVVIHGPRRGVVARVHRLLDLDADPQVIGAHLSKDPHLARLVKARPGIRVPGAWDGFEIAVRAILGQQVTVTAATQLAGRLIAKFGKRYDDEHLTHLFPTPQELCDADVAAIGMPKARGAYIRALAAATIAQPDLFEPSDDAVARLRAIPGIGEWTAQYIVMRAMPGGDAFPTGDIALIRALASNGKRPSAKDVSMRAEAWRPWRAYAAIHIWETA